MLFQNLFSCVLHYSCSLKNSYLGGICSKILKCFSQASLLEGFMWAKLQIKIRKYNSAGKSWSSREIWVKLEYLTQIVTWSHILLGFFYSTSPLLMRKIWGQKRWITWRLSLVSNIIRDSSIIKELFQRIFLHTVVFEVRFLMVSFFIFI
jgi:hypothetical protein